MQTEVLDDIQVALAWLEYQGDHGKLPPRVALALLPFTIGRSDTSDLQIESTWVSREHAVIAQVGAELRVRDLGSTNGTHLNGELIEDAILQDGDLLRVGDADFVFRASDPNSPAGSATQVLEPASSDAESWSLPQVVDRLRRVQEMTLLQAFPLPIRRLVDLASGQVRGWHFSIQRKRLENATAGGHLVPGDIDCPANWRLHLVTRLAAMDQFRQQSQAEYLFLRVEPFELENWDALVTQWQQLGAVPPGQGHLVMELPANAQYDRQMLDDLRRLTQDWGMQLAYGGFAGFHVQLRERADPAPSFISIRPGMFQAARSGAAEERLKGVLTSCQKLGAAIIVDGDGSAQERARWESVGVQMVLTDRDLPD